RERGQEQVEQRPGRGGMAPGPGVEDQHNPPDGHEGEGEAGRAAVEGVVDAEGHGDARQHPGQDQDPVQEVVGVEAVGVDGVADPGPPDGHEQAGRAQEVGQAAVVLQGVDELGDRDDEHQVEEELEPAGVPFPLVVEGPQLRRPQPSLPGGDRHLASAYMITITPALQAANAGRPRGIPGGSGGAAPVVASFEGPERRRLVGVEPRWTPSPERGERSNPTRYLGWLRDRRGLRFASYDELWRWSVEDLDGFWTSIWEFFEVGGPT